MSQAEKRSRRLYWRAVNALREAETLADIKAVAGPADEPPRQGEETSWQDEWADRARRALKKAQEWLIENPTDVVKERARGIAGRVRDGASAIKRAAGRVTKKVQDVAEGAQKLYAIGAAGSLLLTVILAYVAWRLWKG